MNLAWRDLRHRLGRFLLTCLGLGLLMGVVLAMIGIYRGLVEDALTLVRAPAADLWVVEEGTLGPFAEASRIPQETRDMVARLHGVAAAGAMSFQSVEIGRADGTRRRVYAVGFEAGRPGDPARLLAGRGITRQGAEIIADRRSGLGLGERVAIGRDRFTVVGLTDGHVASGGDPVVYMTLADAQALQFEQRPASARRQAASGAAAGATDTVNAVVARLSPRVDAAAVAAGVARWKHLSALTQDRQEDLLLRSVVERARKQIGLFTVVLVLVSAVIVALIVYTMTMDKIREIATLKLIGAADRVIVGMVVQQALALGGIGVAAGGAIMLAVKDAFPRRVVLLPDDGLALAVVMLAVCLLASALAVRLALRVDPATALGG